MLQFRLTLLYLVGRGGGDGNFGAVLELCTPVYSKNSLKGIDCGYMLG